MKSARTIHHGFKRISPANLLEEDNHPAFHSGPRGKHWMEACLKPRLASTVPEEIAFLFEVARGSMVYGLFFLPLASLAAEQSYRVLEAAARFRCKELALLKQKPGKTKALPDTSLLKVVAALQTAGAIPKRDIDAWTTMPFLRNRFSHPTSQAISSRHDALKVLAYHAELLNRLFSDERQQT